MKVLFMNGINSDLDTTRGIGVHSTQLTQELTKQYKGEFEIVSDTKDANVTHITKFHPFFLSIPFVKPARKVILTIHDLIPLIYPRHYQSGVKGKIIFLINKVLVRKNVDAIITISETSKKDICRFLDVKAGKVHVIYLSSKKVFRKLKNPTYSGVPKKFALYVGDINYNKNIPNLLKACELARIPLVVVGKQAKDFENLDLNHPELAHLKKIDWSKVIRLGFIADEDLVKIYNLATVYVQPSFYEGFGLPVLDAFASGCPVVASRTQALVEIGEGACLFADPHDPSDMAEKISEVIDNGTLRDQLIETGKELVKNFSWEKTARETFEVYRHV